MSSVYMKLCPWAYRVFIVDKLYLILFKDLIYILGNFLFEYNHLRRHGGLNYQTPYEKLEKVT